MTIKNLVYRRIDGQRGPLSQQLAERIIDLIATNHLQPGDALPSQQELSESFGVSRTVVREGLQILSGMGVIRISQGIRAQLIKTDPTALEAVMRISAGAGSKGMENLLTVRGILEPEVAVLAAKNATAQDLEDMENAISTMERHLDDVERFIDADEAFHLSLANASGNDLLSRITYPVVSLLQEMRRVAVRAEGATRRAQTYHRAILEMVKARDPAGAREAMRAHLLQVRGEVGISEAGNVPEQSEAVQDHAIA